MGAPSNDLAHEIISAMSSLNMEPEPIVPAPVQEGPVFLSQSDAWAKHSMEHLKQAMQILHHRDAQSFVEKLVNKFPELSGIKLTVIASMAQKHFISGE
jgi:hypothetical protein